MCVAEGAGLGGFVVGGSVGVGVGLGVGGNVGVGDVGSRVGYSDGEGVGGTAQQSPFIQPMQRLKPTRQALDHATDTARGACE